MSANDFKRSEEGVECGEDNDTEDGADGHEPMERVTLKAAVLACWPEWDVLTAIRAIRSGQIARRQHPRTSKTEETISHSSAATNSSSSSNPSSWRIERHFGKRNVLLHPSVVVYLRHNDNDCRIVPTYPRFVLMHKPAGYETTLLPSSSNSTSATPPISDRISQKGTDGDHDDNCDHPPDGDGTMNGRSDEHCPLIRDDVETCNNSVCTTSSAHQQLPQTSPTVYDILYEQGVKHAPQLRAVGRLDKDTEGALLFTSHTRWILPLLDPPAKHQRQQFEHLRARSTSASHSNDDDCSSSPDYTMGCPKRYRCWLEKPATQADLDQWMSGTLTFRDRTMPNGIAIALPALSASFVQLCDDVEWTEHCNDTNEIRPNTDHTTLSDSTTSPIASASQTDSDCGTGTSSPTTLSSSYVVDVTIVQGRYRQVRRCWETLHNRVIRLQRLSFGPIRLWKDDSNGEYLPIRHCRELSLAEVRALRMYVFASPMVTGC